MPGLLPVGRQLTVPGIIPVLEDLVENLGHDRLPRIRLARLVRIDHLLLRDSDTGMGPEDAKEVQKIDEPGDEFDEEDGGDGARPLCRRRGIVYIVERDLPDRATKERESARPGERPGVQVRKVNVYQTGAATGELDQA